MDVEVLDEDDPFRENAAAAMERGRLFSMSSNNWASIPIEPFEVVEEALAKQIILTAEVLLPRREASEREVQLWIKHVGKHWGTVEMARGPLEYEKAMIAEGLSNRTLEEVQRFYSPETFTGVKFRP